MRDFLILPTILETEIKRVQDKLDLVRGITERVQIDIVDEKFASKRTIRVEELEGIRTEVGLEIQLMVDNPARYLNRCDVVGASRIYGHVEQMLSQAEFVDQAVSGGVEVGLAMDIHTPVEAITEMLPHLDGVLLVSVEVGAAGQKFDRGVLKKIEELREKQFEGDICVDGGLDSEEIGECLERGANQFAVNTALWNPFGKLRASAKDIRAKLEELRALG